MIDETLKLKRFTDDSVVALFAQSRSNIHVGGEDEVIEGQEKDILDEAKKSKGLNEEEDEDDEREEDEDDGDAGKAIGKGDEDGMQIDSDQVDTAATDIDSTLLVDSLGAKDRDRLLELRDAVRVGFKAGLGSRQNAPAEWIGESISLFFHCSSTVRRVLLSCYSYMVSAHTVHNVKTPKTPKFLILQPNLMPQPNT